jgi:hypothetical protein
MVSRAFVLQSAVKLPVLLAAALTLALGPAAGRFPGVEGSDPWMNRPNDPAYRDTWQLFSHIPYNQVSPVSDTEMSLGAGMHVDRAWQLHTGTPAARIAVLDSGIIWDSPDLRERYALNTGELPLPAGFSSYDANSDGRVTPFDWSSDPALQKIFSTRGFLTPDDLIVAFSDGVDSDGNGFIDDIAGWDFLERDNNPSDRTAFGHGTMEGNLSAGAVNNGIESAGACGNCSIAFLRVNDSFMADSNVIASAIRYAADQGFDVIQAALGPFNMTPALREAVDYASSKDVVIVGTAADENSYHNNQPAVLDQVIFVNALRYSGDSALDSASYLAFNNCSNHGARIDVTASGRYCSSEATGRLAGIMALAKSYSRTSGQNLSAGELIATMRAKADDVKLGPVKTGERRMQTLPGWDSTTGQGRVNAWSLISAIKDGDIFPAGRITSPGWFDVVPQGQVSVPVEVAVPLPRSGVMRLRITIQRGIEESGADVLEIATTPPLTGDYSGSFVGVDLKRALSLKESPHETGRFSDAWTLVLEIDDFSGHVSRVRRTFFWLLGSAMDGGPSFVFNARASFEGAPLIYDIDGDGDEEFAVADAAGLVHVFERAKGQARLSGRPGFPVSMPLSAFARGKAAAVFAPLAGGEVEKGKRALVAVSVEGHVALFDAAGRMFPGFPRQLPFPSFGSVRKGSDPGFGVLASPVLADLDGDGKLEVIVAGLDGQIHAFRADGSDQPGFPYPVVWEGNRAKIVSSPLVSDLDGNGTTELVFGTSHYSASAGFVFALSGRGSLANAPVIPGFPARIPLLRNNILPLIGAGITAAPAGGDIDGDGLLDIFVHGFAGKGYILGHDGAVKRSLAMRPSPSSPAIAEEEMAVAFGQGALADIDADGVAEIFAPGVGRRILLSLVMGGQRVPYGYLLGGWRGPDGSMLQGFPGKLSDTPLMGSPVFADVTGDGKPEVIVADAGFELHAFQADGTGLEVKGFPKRTGGWMLGSPAAADIDGDGLIEVVGATREGFLFVWDTPGKANRAGFWGGQYKGNPQRSGVWTVANRSKGEQRK